MDVRRDLMRAVAGQLGKPHGIAGRALARVLNKTNLEPMRAAVDALEVGAGSTVADLGFGGGAGLALLLERVGPQGRVLGLDLSPDMVSAAGRRFRRDVAAGRLLLHAAGLEAMPIQTASLDAAITVNTIYFVTDLDGVLRECVRVLKPGGRFVVGLGDPAAMSHMPFTPFGFKLRPLSEVQTALVTAGLPAIDHRRVGTGQRAFHVLVTRRVA
ncbi:class I SAM-dependent methyltransferase [Modestobacter altitudinis]|uniref:class I SAM-dependent methyltransferase n=1 Tax=Modestobacter altitudinis TaxID=2213158 RepID=UPI001C552013|nr:methyltransferase domain-containing protein [Modestobacter altitudinis]